MVSTAREPRPPTQSPAVKPRPLVLELIRTLRPKQWSKNLLVFAAYIFTASFRDSSRTREALMAFAAICLASSFIYVLNDIIDVEKDRRHPRKRARPIASGAVSVPLALAVGVLALAGSAAIAVFLNLSSIAILGAYLVLQIIYNLGLKRVAVADVFVIGLGFVLRAALGAAAISASLSPWLIFCAGALALMLGFAKRRSEFILLGEEARDVRESLGAYSRPALDALVIMFACGAALCYGIYSVQSPTARHYPGLILTSLFVFYGISRYVLIVFGKGEGGEPESLLYRDPHILASLILFVATAILAIGGLRIGFLE